MEKGLAERKTKSMSWNWIKKKNLEKKSQIIQPVQFIQCQRLEWIMDGLGRNVA